MREERDDAELRRLLEGDEIVKAREDIELLKLERRELALDKRLLSDEREEAERLERELCLEDSILLRMLDLELLEGAVQQT